MKAHDHDKLDSIRYAYDDMIFTMDLFNKREEFVNMKNNKSKLIPNRTFVKFRNGDIGYVANEHVCNITSHLTFNLNAYDEALRITGLYSSAGDIVAISTDPEKALIFNEWVALNPNILDKKEKQYLENVLRPFKNSSVTIRKCCGNKKFERIEFVIDDETIFLPMFERETMYTGMIPHHIYTIKTLGLFE